jgi:hypothetical protein
MLGVTADGLRWDCFRSAGQPGQIPTNDEKLLQRGNSPVKVPSGNSIVTEV